MACNKANLKKVVTHWPDMRQVAGSLITNRVRAYDLLRMFGREGHPHPAGAAFAEYGRIDKTMHGTARDRPGPHYELADERLGHALDDLRTAVVAVETDRTCADVRVGSASALPNRASTSMSEATVSDTPPGSGADTGGLLCT
ncbi:Tn3 family transposase [Streptomyces sp. DW4-2]|uniref:Tn3 family transposase n=1 Tax=Streptomyces spirodelae TaxID=2812904 RepID=A0ABS3WTA6_9ACTN|nr:Tn3 family transposase [Streptomyces spirodelae]